MTKTKIKIPAMALALLAFSTFNLQFSTAHAQGTAFTYQGRLNSGGSPASGSYDLKFSLFATNTTGTAIAGPVTNTATAVSNGLFTTTIDFGAGVFLGSSNWLEIAVSTNGANSFTTLAPRQQLTPTPYAIYSATSGSAATATTATTATSANSVSAANISGTILNSSLPAGVLTNGASGVNISGTFSGNGAGVTNVNASSLVAITNNVVVAWGQNGNGQTTIPANATNVIAVAAGGFHSLALRSDGTVVAWGLNNADQTTIPANATNVIAVAAGDDSSLALRGDGTVVVWGVYGFGQQTIPANATNVIAIAAGSDHLLALRSDGTVVAWGDNTYGQTNVPANATNVIAVAAGAIHSLVLRSDGTVVAWGNNGNGQTNVPANATNVIAVAAGSGHSLALRSDGTVVAWGKNGGGQTNVPANATNVIAIAAGANHSLALRSDGTVVAWGNNGGGQTNVPNGLNHVIALAPGCTANHVLVIQQQLNSPVAVLNWDNTFNGNVKVNGTLSGNGGGLTNLNAAQITSGTIPLGNLPTAVLTNNETGVSLSGNFTGNLTGSATSAGLATNVVSGISITNPVIANAVITNSVFAGNGANLTNLNASQLSSGTIPLAQLPGSLVTNNATGVTLSGAFSGNGSGLTILGATNSYTPTIGDGTINFTTGTARGYYSEAGNLAFVEIWLKWNSKNSAIATSQLQISLPFSVSGSPRALFTLGYVSGITFTNQIIATAIQGSSSLQLFDLVSGGAANNINVTNCSTSGELQLSGFFRTQ